MFESGSLVIEWADIIADALPEERLWVHLRYVDEDQRDLVFSAYGAYYVKLLADFRGQVYGA